MTKTSGDGILSVEQGSREWKRLRKRAQTDLFWLVTKVLNLEHIVPITVRAHYAMCRFAERRTGIPAVDNSRVQLIHVCRGYGKTLLITIGRTIQRILADPDWAAGIANERQENAEAMLAGIKSQLESNEFLHALFPEHNPNLHRTPVWKSSRIITPARTRPNPMNPTVLAAGIDATVTGVHMNEWIVDDLLSEKAAENARSGSFSEIEQLNRRIIELEALTTTPGRDPITYIGTPWWPGDSYQFVQETYTKGEKYRDFVWNLKLPDGTHQSLTVQQAGELAYLKIKPVENGLYMYPERFSEDDLEGHRERDPVFFAAQFLLKPTAGGVAQFKKEYLREFQWEMNQKQIRYKNDDGRIEFQRIHDLQTIISVDPAISKKSGAARSAIVVTASNGNNIFMLESWAERASPHDVAMKVIELYKTYRPLRVVIESVAYQMALAEVITLLAEKHKVGPLPIYEFKAGGNARKPIRIAGLEPYFRRGLFYYHPRSQYNFLEEYLNFSPEIASRLVDILDALSFQVQSWEQLGFLGGEQRSFSSHNDIRKANAAQAQRIRNHYRRGRKGPATLEWEA